MYIYIYIYYNYAHISRGYSPTNPKSVFQPQYT